jgi:hypothetical protein
MSAAERTGEHAAFSENEKSCGEDDVRCFFGRRSHKEEALRGKEKGSRAEHNIAPQIQIRRVKKNCNGCPN